MFDYAKYKRIAIALKNCTSNFTEEKSNTLGWTYEENKTFKSVEDIEFFPSDSYKSKLLIGYFNLFHLPHRLFDTSFPIYLKEPISNRLKNQLREYNILIGLPIYSFKYYKTYHELTYSFKFYQLLIYFLRPFGKIGLVPCEEGCPLAFHPAIFFLPENYFLELENPNTNIISDDKILRVKLKEDNKVDNNFLDVEVFYNYWNGDGNLDFTEYFIKKYSDFIDKIYK